MTDTKSDIYVPTGTLGLPRENNYVFNSSANIPPNFHVGPRMYLDGNYVPHPLQITGAAGPAIMPPKNPAGATSTAPGGADWLIAHPYTINGKSPGR